MPWARICSMHAVISRMISGTSLSPAGSIEICIAMFYTRNALAAIDLDEFQPSAGTAFDRNIRFPTAETLGHERDQFLVRLPIHRWRFEMGNPTPVRRLLQQARAGVWFDFDLNRLHLRQPFHANVFEIPHARM